MPAENPPKYIPLESFENAVIRYDWDEWNLEQSIRPLPQDISERLKLLSLRAKYALTIGAAEWVMYRFIDSLYDDVLPLEALDAAWAQMIDYRYAVPWNPFKRDEWSGPIKGPLRKAAEILRDYADLLRQNCETARGTAKMLELAIHVVPDQRPLLRWCDDCLERLRLLFPRSPEDPKGDPVPPQALDPEYPLNSGSLEVLINEFLLSLDPEDNGFLERSEDMLANGFKGTPYTFSLEADRLKRSLNT